MNVPVPVRLLATSSPGSPFTAGWIRPVVLVPAATVAALPVHYLEAILLHELAHIRRADYLAGLLQAAIEALFFYHPAVWWMSSALRAQREQACDDAVVAAGASPAVYARALLSLEELRAPEFAPAAAAGSLTRRIERLLGKSRPRSPVPALLLTIALPSLALLLLPPATEAQTPTGPYRKWIAEDVVHIVEPAERQKFETLRTAEEMEAFIADFWKRRDPTPGTPANEMKEEHYRRIAHVNIRFGQQGKPGFLSEQGRVYIKLGPPDEVTSLPRPLEAVAREIQRIQALAAEYRQTLKETHPDVEKLQAELATLQQRRQSLSAENPEGYERWFYKWVQGVGSNVSIEFGPRP